MRQNNNGIFYEYILPIWDINLEDYTNPLLISIGIIIIIEIENRSNNK